MQQLNLKQKTVVMGNLWKATAKRESGKLVKGMSVEIPISERSGIPCKRNCTSDFVQIQY